MTASQPPGGRAPAPARSARRLRRAILLVVLPAVAAVLAVVLYLQGGRYVETDNAYVKADKIPVGADVSGLVTEVLVAENEVVAAGQLLFRIDDASFRVAVDKAEAKLAQVRNDLGALKASHRETQARIAAARTTHAFALREQQRQGDLVARRFVSASRFDDARQNAELAAQQIAALEQELRRITEMLGGGADLPVERHANYRSALAELDGARLDLARAAVRAPLAGTVSKPPKPGQYLSTGSTAMALVVSGHLWIEANFPETELTYVRPGQPAMVHIDTYPEAAWSGTVDSLSPATGAEFSLLPAQNATGNWVKIAQRVPVRIRLEPDPAMPPLRAGLSTVVEIDTGHRRRLLGFAL